MIHVNVARKSTNFLEAAYIVETSTDGGGWFTQYHVSDADDDARHVAEDTARIFANGCRYAGAEVRITSCGEPLS